MARGGSRLKTGASSQMAKSTVGAPSFSPYRIMRSFPTFPAITACPT